VAAVAVGWALVKGAETSGSRRAMPWHDLTPQTGPLELPNGLTREFISRPQLAAWLHSRGGKIVPQVVFPRWRVVLVSLGPRSTTAYSIHVVGVSQDDDRVIVRVARRNASLTDPGRPKLTFPYRLITVPTTGKPVQVAWVEAG
jgi:hypothetical protein